MSLRIIDHTVNITTIFYFSRKNLIRGSFEFFIGIQKGIVLLISDKFS